MKKKKRRRAVFPIILIATILGLAGFAGYNAFQVRDVQVVGCEAYAADYIAGLANIPEETLMIKVDEETIKENIESNPFLELTSIDYEMPDTVVLIVHERKPAVTLSYAGNVLLLDRQLNVLEMDGAAEAGNYPELQGVSPDALNLGKQIQTADEYKISVATSILDELENQAALGLVSVLDLSDINNICFKTRNGPEVLFGQSDEPESKIRWMMRILPSMIAEGTTQGILDVSAGSFATYRTEDGTQTQDTQTLQDADTQDTDTQDNADIQDTDTQDNADIQDTDTQDTDAQDDAGTQDTNTSGE